MRRQLYPYKGVLDGPNTSSVTVRRTGPKEVAANRSEEACNQGHRSGIIRIAGDPECRAITQLIHPDFLGNASNDGGPGFLRSTVHLHSDKFDLERWRPQFDY